MQFLKNGWENRAFLVALLLSVPITLCGFFAAKYTYAAVGTAWSVRFIAFGISYLVFPVLTWWLLKESMFTTKTMVCIMLSFIILLVQLFWK
tara:strand:+ start:89 stop:364 length:276 start_codon:yes stop_codon:yes gene_type:complete